MKRASIFALIGLASIASGLAQPQEKLPPADQLKASAKKDSKSAYQLGLCYLYGQGVEQDAKEAVKYFQLAADKETKAAYALGACYASGVGVKEDARTALRWFEKAATQGNADAQYRTGYFYEMGLSGVAKNDATAVKYYRLAAEQGQAEAQYRLAVCYQEGRGVPLDRNQYNEMSKWYREAAQRGIPDAQYQLAKRIELGQGVNGRDMVEAYKWLLIAAGNGSDKAQMELDNFIKINRLTPQQIAAAKSGAKEYRAPGN